MLTNREIITKISNGERIDYNSLYYCLIAMNMMLGITNDRLISLSDDSKDSRSENYKRYLQSFLDSEPKDFAAINISPIFKTNFESIISTEESR